MPSWATELGVADEVATSDVSYLLDVLPAMDHRSLVTADTHLIKPRDDPLILPMDTFRYDYLTPSYDKSTIHRRATRAGPRAASLRGRKIWHCLTLFAAR